jgi:bifunctional DNA-binding transcriptional regulator/antitoxin component of YhaV-PrlF toxin-antitoxin module
METTIQIRGKGVITLPIALRRRYNLNEGDVFTLIDLGDGNILLAPQLSRISKAGEQISALMADANVSLDDLLQALDEERARYYQENYVLNGAVQWWLGIC